MSIEVPRPAHVRLAIINHRWAGRSSCSLDDEEVRDLLPVVIGVDARIVREGNGENAEKTGRVGGGELLHGFAAAGLEVEALDLRRNLGPASDPERPAVGAPTNDEIFLRQIERKWRPARERIQGPPAGVPCQDEPAVGGGEAKARSLRRDRARCAPGRLLLVTSRRTRGLVPADEQSSSIRKPRR